MTTPLPLELWTDEAQGFVTAGGTTAPPQGTSEPWTVNVTAAFPAVSSTGFPQTAFFFYDQLNPGETMQATVAPGGTGTGQAWTVTRGADGSTPVSHSAFGFPVVQCAAGATLRALQNRGLLWLTGGGSISLANITAAQSAGYTGLWLDPKNIWDMTGLVLNGVSNFRIRSDMCGSNGFNGVVSYNTGGYINLSSASADGIQIYATSGTATQGIVFEGCVFVGSSANALIHFGGRQRRCGLKYCMGVNTSSISTTVAAGSNGVNVSTFAGAGTLNVASSAALPSAGQVFVTTTNQGQPGLALVTYTGTGSGTVTGCTTVAGAGTLSTGNLVQPPQAPIIVDTAIQNFNSEDGFLDHVDLASTGAGIAFGLNLASQSQKCNDWSFIATTTVSEGGIASVAATAGGGLGFYHYYDRSPSGSAPLATVWNDGATLKFWDGEDQNNGATGVAHLVSGSGKTICNSRNLSVSSNTATATVTGGTLIARGGTRWSGTLNLAGGTLDLSDPAGVYNNSGAGVLSVSGSSGTLVLAPAYTSGGRPTVTSWTGPTANSSGQKIPRDVGLLAWTADPDLAEGGTFTPVTTTIYLCEFWTYETQTLSNIAIHIQTAPTLTSGNFLGVYSPGSTTFTQLGVTADQTTAWGTTGVKSAAFTSAISNLAPGRYYVALLATGTTLTNMIRALTGVVTQLGNVNASGATLRCMTAGTGATLPGTLAVSGFAATAPIFGAVMW